jgi:hypothetical protein
VRTLLFLTPLTSVSARISSRHPLNTRVCTSQARVCLHVELVEQTTGMHMPRHHNQVILHLSVHCWLSV